MGLIERDDGWRMPDWLWERIEPLLPPPPPHPLGTHRRRIPDRQVMNAILLVLRTGMQWNALTATGICNSSTAHRRFQEWERAGVFHEIWRRGLLDYDAAVGIDWAWLAADGAMTKAPLGGEQSGPNPTDRARRGRNVRSSARRGGCRSGWHATAPTATTTDCWRRRWARFPSRDPSRPSGARRASASMPPTTTARVAIWRKSVPGLGYRSRYADAAVRWNNATTGALRISPYNGTFGSGNPYYNRTTLDWSKTTSTLKRRPPGADEDSFFHARFYDARYLQDGKHRQQSFWAYDPDDLPYVETGKHYVVGTCHLDVNELVGTWWTFVSPSAKYPEVRQNGFPPRPRVPDRYGIVNWKLGGNSEWVENDIARRWEQLFPFRYHDGSTLVKRDAADAETFSANNTFAYKTKPASGRAGKAVRGKWWVSDGKATVLEVPSWEMYKWWPY